MIVIAVMSVFDVPFPVTVKVAVPVATVLSALVNCAEMVVVPCPTAVATPDTASTVAICVLDELQITSPVRLSVNPEAVVPTTEYAAVSPGEATVWLLGIIVTSVMSLLVVPEPVIVKVAVPVAVVLSALTYCAVMVVVPWPTAVATPVAAFTVAICGALEVQVTRPCILTVVPAPVVPIAT